MCTRSIPSSDEHCALDAAEHDAHLARACRRAGRRDRRSARAARGSRTTGRPLGGKALQPPALVGPDVLLVGLGARACSRRRPSPRDRRLGLAAAQGLGVSRPRTARSPTPPRAASAARRPTGVDPLGVSGMASILVPWRRLRSARGVAGGRSTRGARATAARRATRAAPTSHRRARALLRRRGCRRVPGPRRHPARAVDRRLARAPRGRADRADRRGGRRVRPRGAARRARAGGRSRPVKLNYNLLGNSVPHLHTHIVPRYADDPRPGWPFPFPDPDPPAMPEERLMRDVEALRRACA